MNQCWNEGTTDSPKLTCQILDDVVRAVDPGDGDNLEEGKEEEVPRWRGRVEEREGVDAAAAREDEAEREHGGGQGGHESGLVPARGGELVGDGADDRLEGAENAAQREGDEHGEEECRPEVGARHPGQHLGVDDEGEAGSASQDLKIPNDW